MDLNTISEGIRQRFEAKVAGRETALACSRRVIRSCANGIRAIHRGDFDEADRLIAEAESELRGAQESVTGHPDIYYAGFLQDAQVEFVEAKCLYALVHGDPLPTPADLGVGDAPYCNGLGDTVGELRRLILDHMRHGNLDTCEDLLATADDIYLALMTMDFPDAVTGGLRRRSDVARSLLERTRAEYTVAILQKRLADALTEHAQNL